MTEQRHTGLTREELEAMLIETIGSLGPDDANFTLKLAAGIAAVIDRNNQAR